ncbi:MAG: transposase [Chitinophagales bacterium]|nr:transposase [Chitinophagales bacterium]
MKICGWNSEADNGFAKLTQNKACHRRLIKRRSATVEPVLGTLINFMNLKRVYTRGMAAANKHTLMSALCYNLKKLLKFNSRKIKIQQIALQKPLEKLRSYLISIHSPAFRSIISMVALNSTFHITNFASEN